MNDTPGLASSQHFTLTSEEPAQGLGLPAGSLREAWADELRALEQSDSLDVLALGLGRTSGWLSALVAAQVIDWPTHKALDAARTRIYDAACQRLLGGDQ